MLRVGCSGWSYKDWIGPFYPKDAQPSDYLRLYASIFDAVEVDSTFYRTPSSGMVSNWKRATGDNFRFTAKFPKKITHELKLRDAIQQLERFYALEEKRDLFKQGYVFFNNHFAGFGPGSVNEFRRLAGLAQLDWKALSTQPGPLQASMSQFQN